MSGPDPAAGGTGSTAVLEVRDVSIRFGGLQALAGISLEVNEYEIVGLIGPNGAGKTTAFNCVTGFYTADSGTVRYRGRDVTRMPPHKKAAIGFGRTFQNVGMVKGSTAMENLKTAQHARTAYDVGSGLAGTGTVRKEERSLEQRADAILDLLGLTGIRDKRVGGLPYGVLKLLEVGCALATDPDVLLLDEPSSGMGPEEAHQLGDRLLTLRRELGLTMLLIEHHVPLVTAVCDHVYVLNFGRLLAEGPPEEVKRHPEVVAAYLGGEAPQALAATEEPLMDAVLDHPETLTEDELAAAAELEPQVEPMPAPRVRAPRATAKPRTGTGTGSGAAGPPPRRASAPRTAPVRRAPAVPDPEPVAVKTARPRVPRKEPR